MGIKKTVVKRTKKTSRLPRRRSISKNKSNSKDFSSKYKSTVKSIKKSVKSIPKSTKRGKSEYQLFVKKHMKDPKIQTLPVTERMKEIAKLWKKK